MSGKKLLKREYIEKIFDDQNIEVNDTDDLIEKIKADPNAKFNLKRFFKDNKDLMGTLGMVFKRADECLEYLKENYYVNESELEEDDDDEYNIPIKEEMNFDRNGYAKEKPEFAEEKIECAGEFEKIVAEMEQEGYKHVIRESEETFSSNEVRLVETNVIENGILKITWRSSEPLDMSKIFIMEEEGNQVLALGHLLNTDKENRFWGVFDNSDTILYNRFEGQNQVRLVVYTKDGKAHSCVSEMNYIKMETEKEKPLCIDFGTSNTTAGSYGIKTRTDTEIVRFVNVMTEPHDTEAAMLPTVIYVDDCSDKNNVRYLFGYEALKRIEQEEHYEFKGSAFFELKRWMTFPEKEEELRDSKNNKVRVQRKYIIKKYIDYVIEKSEQYFGVRFKNIHFSAPVKLKSSFIKTFKEMYKNEKVILDESQSIDEAFAIVYNQIINIINYKKETIPNKSVLIMDCGGGTTDLATCSFSYTQREGYTDELRYTTRFENGNPNFGGNNITYRVMQLLKIKIASGFDDSIKKDAMLLINKTEDEILNTIEIIDRNGAYNSDDCRNEIYEEFVDEYNKCEKIIPTGFAKEFDLDAYESKCRKRNFYCMWRLAEKIKIEFFNSIKVQFNFSDQEVKELLVDSSNDYFYVNNKDTNELEKRMNPLKNVTITNKDVERIICGDIYGLLYGLMKKGSLSDDGGTGREVENFDNYKLSGQSCKIPMFKELLKEYIPGRKLRPYAKGKIKTDNRSEALKLECLQGCIKYIKDRRGHELNIIPNIERPKIIYNVYILKDHDKDKKIFDCTRLAPEDTVFEIFNSNSNEMNFEIRNDEGIVERTFSISLDDKQHIEAKSSDEFLDFITKECSFEYDYMKTILLKMSEKLDTVDDDDVKVLFCVPSPDYYGTDIFLIQRITENGVKSLKLLNYSDATFDNPDKTFFDGKR